MLASLLTADMQNGVDTFNAIIAVNMALNGQLAGRTTSINGWTEALNDGQTPSWDGNVYTFGFVSENSPPGSISKATFDGNRLTLEYFDAEHNGVFTK